MLLLRKARFKPFSGVEFLGGCLDMPAEGCCGNLGMHPVFEPFDHQKLRCLAWLGLQE